MLEYEDKNTEDIIRQRQRLRGLRFKLRLIEEFASLTNDDDELAALDTESIDKMYDKIKGKAMYSYAKHFV